MYVVFRYDFIVIVCALELTNFFVAAAKAVVHPVDGGKPVQVGLFQDTKDVKKWGSMLGRMNREELAAKRE